MSTTLTSDQRTLLRAQLEQRRAELNDQLSEHLHGQSRVERAAEVASQDADDAPQRMPEREISMALTDREQRELEAATAALLQIDDAQFGACIDCNDEIPFVRMKAEPWATRCIDCETVHEVHRR